MTHSIFNLVQIALSNIERAITLRVMLSEVEA